MSFEQHLRDLPTQIIAPVAIGTTKYQMLVDTGAGSSALDLSIAKESVAPRDACGLERPEKRRGGRIPGVLGVPQIQVGKLLLDYDSKGDEEWK